MADHEDQRPNFDLQSHSTCSDGALAPAEVVSRAGAAGVRLLALSDHDSVSGVEEALVAGEARGVTIVPAVELSAHPFWDNPVTDAVLETLARFAGFGLDGVEAFYVTHERGQAQLLDYAARRLGLLSTGSSDFHGPEHAIFSRFRAFSLWGRE